MAGVEGEPAGPDAGLTVGEVARLARVTVRALHHYDAIGLLRPGARTGAGHRRYGPGDLARLERLLAYRDLGLDLAAVRALLDDPAVDPVDHLRRRHAQVVERIRRLQEQRAALERNLEAHAMGIDLTPEEVFEVFGDDDPARHAGEAEQRWGDTDAWRESQRRTSSYTRDDWLRIRRETDASEQRLADALAAGLPADGPEAVAAAEDLRLGIDRWFYACSPAMHRAVAEMYVDDERFAAHYERRAAGLARYTRDAVRANADRAAGAGG